MKELKIAIVGVGNCASSLIQGIEFYKNTPTRKGLINEKIGDYGIENLRVVAAFDIAANKVGKDLSEAIFEYPNCTEEVYIPPKLDVKVQMGPVLDGMSDALFEFVEVSDNEVCDVKKVLINSEADVMVILLPTAAREACYYYARTALELGICVVNGIPVLLTHDRRIVELAEENKTCIVGDDFKSQIGGAILHRTLLSLLDMRGINIKKTHQLNFAGNTDFLNLIDRGRTKHESKKRSVVSLINQNVDIDINVSYLPNNRDNKTCIIHIEGENFSCCPITIDAQLCVVDSPNASGVMIDALRYVKVAKENGEFGLLNTVSAFYMKSPVSQMHDSEAYEILQKKYREDSNNGIDSYN